VQKVSINIKGTLRTDLARKACFHLAENWRTREYGEPTIIGHACS